MTVVQLKAACRNQGLKGYSKLRKAELEALLAGKTIATPSQPSKSVTVASLKAECRQRGLTGYSHMRKAELVAFINRNKTTLETIVEATNAVAAGTFKLRTDDEILADKLAAMPASLSETLALAKYMRGVQTTEVKEILMDRERRAILELRESTYSESDWQNWHARYLRASGVVC